MKPYFILSNKFPLLLFEFLKTSRRARKKIQYNIAAKTAITTTIRLLKIHNVSARRIAEAIQRRILAIAPIQPFSMSNSTPGSPAEKSGVKSIPVIGFKLSVIFPRLSLSFMPLYNPTEVKAKKAKANMEVEIIEISKKV